MLKVEVARKLYWWWELIRLHIKPLHFLLQIIARLGVKGLAKIQHFKLPPDTPYNYQMLLGLHETGTTSICKSLVRSGMTIVDAGAHVGYFASLFARLVGRTGRVYAFEPHPNNFCILKHNIGRFENVIPVQMAVSDGETETILYESSSSQQNSIWEERHETIGPITGTGKQIPVKTTSMDNYFRGKTVDLVKVDVEGAELEVLRGMRELIRRSENLALIIEFYPPVFTSRGLAPRILLDTLFSLGFKVCRIDESTGTLVPLSSLESHEQLISSIRKYVNLLCYKGLTKTMVELC